MRQKELFDLALARGYRVDESGKMYGASGKELKVYVKKSARYPQFNLCVDGKPRTMYIHRFAGYVFYGDEIFTPGLEVRHLNGNVLDFKKSNIALGTSSENKLDMPKELRLARAKHAGSYVKGKRRFSEEQVREIRRRYASGESAYALAKEYGVSDMPIHKIVKGLSYRDVE